MLTARRLTVAAGALILAAGLILLARRAADVATFGDTAVIESYTWMASIGDLLLGPYSRFQWHHPGPISFYLVAPFYALSGDRPAGLNAGALALNLAMLAIMTSVIVRRAGGILSVALLTSVAVYSWRIGPVLTSAWNPHVVVVAMMALLMVAAETLSGASSMLPVVAALASLIGQTHVALLPSALAVGGVAMAGMIVGSWRKERTAVEISRSLLATLAVLIVLWALPLVEQFTGHPGNISQLWTFFVSEPHRGQRFASAFSAWSNMLTGLVRPDFAVATGVRLRQGPRGAEAFAVLQLAGLIVAAVLAATARRRFERSLAALLLLVSVLALWSATRIEETIFDHEVFWISAVGVLNIALLASLVGQLLAARRSSLLITPLASAAVCWVLFACCAGIGLWELWATVVDSSKPSSESEAISSVANQLLVYFDRERIVRPLVRIDQDAWPLAAGVILRLQKRGVPVAVEDDWVPMFTPAFAATGREAVVLAIDAKPQHVRSLGKSGDEVVVEHDPLLFVHHTTR